MYILKKKIFSVRNPWIYLAGNWHPASFLLAARDGRVAARGLAGSACARGLAGSARASLLQQTYGKLLHITPI